AGGGQGEGDRQGGKNQGEWGLGRWVDVERQRLDADLRIELARDSDSLQIDAERHHLEALAAEPGLQPVESRHFFAAGLAPRCPYVEQNHLAAKIAERMHAAVCVLEAQLRYRFRPRASCEGQLALRLPDAE